MIKKIVWVVMLGMATSLTAQNAQKLLNEGRVDEVTRTLEGARDGAGLELLCRAWYWQENWEKAINACERAVQAEPNVGRHHLWLARAQGNRADQVGGLSAFGLARKTRENFERAHALDAGDVEATHDVAEFYLEAPSIVGGGVDKAEKTAAYAPAPVADWIHATAAAKRKDATRAEQMYRQAVRDSGFGGDAWLDLARFFRSQHRWSEFEDAIQHAVSSGKHRPTNLFEGAELLVTCHRNAGLAEKLLRQYLAGRTSEDAPTFRAHWLLGEVLAGRGDAAGARKEYQAALGLASGYKPALRSMQKLGGR